MRDLRRKLRLTQVQILPMSFAIYVGYFAATESAWPSFGIVAIISSFAYALSALRKIDHGTLLRPGSDGSLAILHLFLLVPGIGQIIVDGPFSYIHGYLSYPAIIAGWLCILFNLVDMAIHLYFWCRPWLSPPICHCCSNCIVAQLAGDPGQQQQQDETPNADRCTDEENATVTHEPAPPDQRRQDIERVSSP